MTDALKPVSAALATLAAAGGSANAIVTASATAASLPPSLVNLAAGNVLAGIVIERARGAVLLKTDKGLLQLATSLPLKLGASVVLEVQSVGAQLRFAVVSVDQHAPQSAAPDVAPDLARGPAPLPSAPRHDGSTAPDVTASPRATVFGRIVTAEIIALPDADRTTSNNDAIATLLRRVTALTTSLGSTAADPRATARTASAVPFPAAETLETILAAIEALPPETAEALLNAPPKPLKPAEASALATPASGTAKEDAASPRAAPTSPSSTPSAPQSPPASAPRSPGVIAAGSTPAPDNSVPAPPPKLVAIRLLDILPPTPDAARSGSARPAGNGDSITLVGTIVSTDDHPTELATPIGTLRLPIAAALPAGSRIAFEVIVRPQGAAELPGQAPIAPNSGPPQRTLAADPPRGWPALRDAAAVLPQDGDGIPIIPRPGPALGPALLAFLVGLRGGGSARVWLGSATAERLDSPERTRLIERLGDELAAQARAAAVPDRNGWQTMAVPVLDGERFNEIRVHVQNRRKADRDGGESGSRFIVEAVLSAVGPLQLDGLVRASRFDLIVRTPRPLPEPMRRNIETLFAQSLSDTAYRGGVSFRGDAEARASVHAHDSRGTGVIV